MIPEKPMLPLDEEELSSLKYSGLETCEECCEDFSELKNGRCDKCNGFNRMPE